MFKTKRKKLIEQVEQVEQERLNQEAQDRERIVEEEQRKQKKTDNLILELEKMIENDVVCVWANETFLKNFAMTYLFEKGYSCVQNDIAFGKYGLDCYVLTFAKGDAIGKFLATK